jgi:hypothetical protein
VNIEDQLRTALRREEAPSDFAAKVLAKASARRSAPVPIWQRPAVVAIAAGLALAALMPPAVSEYHRREEARGLEAKRELLVALTITRTKLLQVKERIKQNTRHTL